MNKLKDNFNFFIFFAIILIYYYLLRFLFGLRDRHWHNFSERIRHSERQRGNFLGARKHSHNTCIGRYIPKADGEILWVLVDTRTTLALDSKYRK